MDELPPKTPMTPGVGPRFGLEEETSFAGNTAPTVVSSEGTSTVAERLWRAKVAKKLQKKAWNRYWKKDKFCEAAGVRDADCKRYLELSRRHRDELSYDEEDELAALQKRIHQGGARAVRPERTMQPWEARLRRLSSVVKEAPQPQQVRRKKKTRVGRPRSAADNSLTAKRLKDVRNRERRELAARTEDGSLASQVSHDGDVRAHLAMTRAADNATSIPEAAMLVAPPIEFLHPQGLPPQHLLVPVRNHHPPEWVKPTGKSPPPSLEATSVNDTASLTTVETAATTGTAMTPGTLDTPETPLRLKATRDTHGEHVSHEEHHQNVAHNKMVKNVKKAVALFGHAGKSGAAVASFKAFGKIRSRRRGKDQARERIQLSRRDLVDLNPQHIVDLLRHTSLEELKRAAASAPYREEARQELQAALEQCRVCRNRTDFCEECKKCANGWFSRNRWALERIENEVSLETRRVLMETEKASVFEPCRRSLDDTPPKEEDTRRKKIAQTIVREQQRQYDWLDKHDRKREIVSERDTPMKNRFDGKDRRINIPLPVGPTGLVTKKIPLEGKAVYTKVDELKQWDAHLANGRSGTPAEWPNCWRKTKKELAEELAAAENRASRASSRANSRPTTSGTRVSFALADDRLM